MNHRLIAIAVVSWLLPSGCSDDFLEETDPNSLVASTAFDHYPTAQLAVNGAYVPLKEVDLWGDQIHFLLHQITDEYGLLFRGNPGWNQIKDFSLTPDNTTIRAVWNGLSKMVLRANAVLEGLNQVPPSAEFTAEQQDELRGEAYFLRGLAWFVGVNIFGPPVTVNPTAAGFPVITTVPEGRAATLVPRASVAEVYQRVTSDWEAAERLLPPAWSGSDVGRATRGAAAGFLGKAYLYQQDWEAALHYLEQVIDHPAYRLLDAFEDNFNGEAENGRESIFEIQYSGESPVSSFNGGPGHAYATRHAPAELDAFGNVSVPPATYERIRADPRAAATVIRPGDFLPFIDTVFVGGGATDYRPRKFIDPRVGQINSSFGSTFNGRINMPLMRLADVYLMYAEAQNEVGNAAVAREYLNKVRRRAYGQPVDTPSAVDVKISGGAALRQAIQQERYVELLGEGHRWFDLRRWEQVGDAGAERGFRAGVHEAMPVPLDEIQLNRAIKQNPGY